MRQIMPHRNNIGAHRFRCKSFLHPMGSRSLKSSHCGIPVKVDDRNEHG
jgi:hypothetical protein